MSEFRTFSWKSWSVTSMVLMVPPGGFGLECRQGPVFRSVWSGA
ncbi:hypothetical protein ACFFX0_17090 [Citricoccus parietis]|uniref:Uncharacterized protein n=1 Tax=Citricoccus parietis TaxID=592307 RepID=A0ABV5G1L0_9MICC